MSNEQIKELKEEWKQYNGYQVSNYGKVIGKRGKYLKTKAGKDGYVHTSIIDYDGNDIRGLHRIVATIFISNTDNLPEVNHIDGVKTNNRVDNLEWCTKKYNQTHASYVLGKRLGEDCTRSFLTEEKVIEIYNLCKDGEMLYKDIAKLYSIFPQEVTDIAQCTYWKGLNLEPLPKLTRGSRRRTGRKVVWINENKEYNSITKCSDDLRNNYNIVMGCNYIRDICNGKLEEWKGQKFKFVL
jgi:hypothetical protein